MDHFEHPRNLGRLSDADGVGRVDDAATDTMVQIFIKLSGGRVTRATFRTFGCSACIAASSMATELLIGRDVVPSPGDLDSALGGLPADKLYCADLVAEAARRALHDALDV
ncbi:MAG TPA: iron-sulfur cluster assembly scaffold protein [Chloroflexota bacterium]